MGFMGMFMGNDKKIDVKNAKLTAYHYNSGGGMSGGGNSVSVKAFDDTHALVSYSSQSWHGVNPTVNEYLADIKILEDIEAVFRKNGMEEWNDKKFTDMFVCDGPSYGYQFDFNNYATVRFSSQIYPEPYSGKLKELEEAISKNDNSFEKMPALITEVIPDAEVMNRKNELKNNGKLSLEVYAYSRGQVRYRVYNGTKELSQISSGTYKLYKEGESTPISEMKSPFGGAVTANSEYEQYVPEVLWLKEGTYRIDVGMNAELSCTFTIG